MRAGRHAGRPERRAQSSAAWPFQPVPNFITLHDVNRCYSSSIHPTDAADAAGGFHDRCDTFQETLVIGKRIDEPGLAFGGFAAGSWAGTGFDSVASSSFLMELSPYPRRWESLLTNNFISKAVNGWPSFGASAELRFGTNGPLGQGQNHPSYYAQCVAGTTYGTEANQPCGANPGSTTWGETEMEVYYRCGEGSGNGPCPWDAPPPPAERMSFGDNVVVGANDTAQQASWEASLESWGVEGNWTK
jgi:hypothetical protein